MEMISLRAQARQKDVPAKIVRRQGMVPCVLYGNEVENTGLQCDYSELFRAYSKAGESVIVDLDAAGKKVPALFHEVQFAPVTDAITHVDFYAVNMKKSIEARIPLHFTGESEAVKGLGGVMVTVMDHLTVKCLPTALPSYIEVPIDSLTSFAESVLVSDIAVPAGVEILEEPDAMIVTVQEPRKEAEPEEAEVAATETTGEAAPEENEKEKKEE